MSCISITSTYVVLHILEYTMRLIYWDTRLINFRIVW